MVYGTFYRIGVIRYCRCHKNEPFISNMIMKRTKRIVLSMWVLLAFCLFGYAQQPDSGKKIVVAYVTSWSKIMPDAKMMTHINYAFGHVNDTFDGVRVDNPERLKQIVALKKEIRS